MPLIECELSRIIINELSDQQVIWIKECNGERAFPIVIGIFEAIAIDRRIRQLEIPRPLTHDLIRNIISKLNGKLESITINRVQENTFYALLNVKLNDEEILIDARPSDAIAIAVRTNSKIYVEEAVLDISCS